MQIFWHGQSCFQILANKNKGENLSIVIDPFSKEIGLKLPKLEADILLVSHDHQGHNNVEGVGGNYFLIQGPGEYEIKSIFVQGIESFHDNFQGKKMGKNTIFVIEAEDLRICHLGDFGQEELSEEQMEAIGEVDVLLLPVGGKNTISAKEASRIMNQLEPKITIPMHYWLPGLKTKLDSLDKFLKIFGIKSLEATKKLSIKKKDLSPEEAKIVVLKP